MQHDRSSALRVLLVEDSDTDAKLVLRALRPVARQIVSERVETAEQLRAALMLKQWDLVLSDWSLPHFSARQALDVVHELNVNVPLIIVSGTIGEEAAVDAMRAGVRDYVLKENLARLAPAVERELREDELRRSAARALKLSERRFERLSSSGLIGICVLDHNGVLTEANETCLRMLGYEASALAEGLRWSALTPAESGHLKAVAWQRLAEQGVAPAWEQPLLRRNGARIWVVVGMATLEDGQYIAILADVTERRAAEERLRHSEEQLRQVQKMEAIGSLAGGIAHDFNNMLTVVLSYSSLLAREFKPEDPRRAELQQIHDAGERAAALTKQLLAFSRRQVLQPKIVRLDQLVTHTERMLRRLIGEHIDLRVRTAPDLWKVQVDPGQIDQVIVNLSVNARDAMPQGGTLTIETENVTVANPGDGEHPGDLPPGRYVRLTVTDTGVGMNEATQSRMFEPFFTTKEVGRGTGLGLPTVLGIVQQSGGSVLVRSASGEGTRASIYLPRSDGPIPIIPTSRPPACAMPHGNETILLVEDDVSVRTLACNVLRRHGYHVLEANGGGDALLLSEQYQKRIHLLLTDVVMPQMSGPQLSLRMQSLRPGIRVMFMSGYTDDATVQHGLVDRTVDLLPKPFTPDEMARRVRAALDGEEPAGVAGGSPS